MRLVVNFLRSFATKLVVLIAIFIAVPLIIYEQFLFADIEKRQLLLKSAQEQGRLMADAIRIEIERFDPRVPRRLTEALQRLGSGDFHTKLLFRPREATGSDNFFYIAAMPVVTAEYLEQERVELVSRGILARVRRSCDGAGPLSERYVNPAGREEILTSLTPLNTDRGCWVVITSHSTAAFLGSSIGRSYWETPEVQIAAAIYVLMAVFVVSLFADTLTGLRRFARLARDIRATDDAGRSFASLVKVPELRGVAAEFDRLVARLRASADQIRFAAEENAHAFKTPIAVIAQAIEPLKRAGGADDERHRRSIDMIEQSIERLDELVAAARRMDESAAELLDSPTRRVDLSVLVGRTAESYAATLPEGSPRVVQTLMSGLDVMAGEEMLETVVENLLDNAIGFAPQGTEITLSLSRDSNFAKLGVEDCGPGVDPADLPHIFERYFSKRPAGTEGKHSSHFGIGLGSSVGTSRRSADRFQPRIAPQADCELRYVFR
jgi:two-component system, OmpR family, sensor histidine kinase ChvG